MSSGSVLSFIVLAVLGGSLFFFIRAEGGVKEIPRLIERAGITIPWPSEAPTTPEPTFNPPDPFTSGNSRFSQGRCTLDTDCRPLGCSGEVCTSQSDAMSTCEYSETFPNALGLNCGCVQGVCGWE